MTFPDDDLKQEIHYCWCGYEDHDLKRFDFHRHITRKEKGQ